MSHPRSILTLLTVVLALIASACLGPDEFDPTGSAPIGRLDAAIGDGASIRVIGWVIDPDVTGPINVEVTISNKTTSYPAKLARADVAAARPRHGPNHGFDIRSQALPAGVHQVCVWAKNVGRGTRDRGLGCADVRVTNDNAVGQFSTVAQVGQNKLRVTGWAYDPDASDVTEILATVAGQTSRLRAGVQRADLKAFFRKSGNHGLDTFLTAPTGDQRVCMTTVNQNRGTSTDLGCKTIRVNDSPGVPARATLNSSVQVAPPVGHPLRNIDRDAGVSVGLSDGARLWLFGDSSEKTPAGALKYFVNNTAALTTPDEPAVPRDAVDADGRPFTFVTPTGVSCPAGFNAVMWPTSANVVKTEGPTDTVLAFFANVCLRDDQMLSRGIALVSFEYLHASLNPADPQRLSGQVLTQHLFPKEQTYGDASIVRDGWLYAYYCGQPSDERPPGVVWPNDPSYDGCRVARVHPEGAADAANWAYWNGADPADEDSWELDRDSAATMAVPGDAQELDEDKRDRQMPPASFTITPDPHRGFVFVYSPWPGFSDEVVVRTADSPTGPWSARSVVKLPGCGEWAFGRSWHCYAGTAQTWRSTPNEIGIGYYDQFAALNPARGAYVAASAPG